LEFDKQGLKEVSGAREWRIEETDAAIWLTVETAIRYVTQMRDQSNDPVIKRNADRTLAVLARHR